MELLVALVITVLVIGTAMMVAVPVSRGFRTLPEHADVQQRLRAVVEALRADVLAATSGIMPEGAPGFQDAWPAVRPCGWAADPVSAVPGPCARSDVLSVTLAPRALALPTSQPMLSAAAAVPVARPSGCGPAQSGCVFDTGDDVVVADGYGAVDVFTVSDVANDGTLLGHAAPLWTAYTAGASVTSGRVRTYYVREDPAAGGLHFRRTDGASDVPVLDHLAGFFVEYAGIPARPDVSARPDGTFQASYGPAPRHIEAGPAGGRQPIPSCAFDIVGGRPESTLQDLPAGPDGLAVLPLAILSDGPWCPDAVSPARFDADLFRVARVRIIVRAQTPAAWARGPDRAFFARPPGLSRGAADLVPDVHAVLELAVRGAAR